MTTKTDDELNRALAEKLEPLPPREKLDEDFLLADTDACGVTYGRSPKKLWYAYEGGAQPADFHTDPAAMVALIEAMAKVGYRWEAMIVEPNGVYSVCFKGDILDGCRGGSLPLAVRDAAAKALELI